MRGVQGEQRPDALTVADLGEDDLLARVFPILAAPTPSADVRTGPGDDAAVLRLAGPGERHDVVATTDAMVRGSDWRAEWSSGADVGAKAAAQNLADVAAMGARPVALRFFAIPDEAAADSQ